MSSPEITVVIPTTRRETRLAFALEALDAQTLPRDRFEVVVVRGEHPGDRTGVPDGLESRVIDTAPAGPAVLRNIGWRAARAPLVAFTDDDCRPAPGWLAALLRAAGDDGLILQGPTEPDPDERHLLYGIARSVRIPGPSDWYETCNMAYPHALLADLDGFDEQFLGGATGPEGGEDTDLALRALAAGATRAFVPDALVWHAVHTRGLVDALRDVRRWRTIGTILARHPSQRSALHLGLFWKRSHARLALAAAAIPVRHRPLLALLAAAPYLHHHVRGRAGGPRGLPQVALDLARAGRDLPAQVLVDAAEVAVVAGSGVRNRTPVL